MKKIKYIMSGVVLVLGHTLYSQTQITSVWTFYNKTYQPNNIVAAPLFSIPEVGSAGDSLKTRVPGTFPGYDNPQNGPINVTASVNNVRYNAEMVPGQGDKGLMFGVGNTNGVKALTKRQVSVKLSDIGTPVSSYYSPDPNHIGNGMHVDSNYSINMFTSVEGLQNDNSPSLGYYYMGDVTFTLSRKVKIGPTVSGSSNSLVMHVTGLGGFFGRTSPADTLPFVTEFVLSSISDGVVNRPNIRLTRLSGTPLTVLIPGVAGADTIKNNYDSTIYLQHTSSSLPTNGNNTGTGSFLFSNSSNSVVDSMKTVTFKVYMRGLMPNKLWSSTPALTTQSYNGDRYTVSFALVEFPLLPASGIHLNAALNGNDVSLSWKTETELNSDHFEIERSSDGINFAWIGNKQAAGNSVSTINYVYADPNMAAPVYYYRLKLVDIDGKTSYSNVAVVRKPNGIKGMRVFPNPASDQVNLEFSNAKGNYEISVYNQGGQLVMGTNATIASTVQYLNMPKGSLSKGSYIISARNTETNEKFVQNVIFK